MSPLAIILLILLGILLLLIEFLIIPGVTIAGIGGFILIAGGIFSAYHFHDVKFGNITVASTVLVIIIIFFFALRSRTWNFSFSISDSFSRFTDNIVYYFFSLIFIFYSWWFKINIP